MRIKKVWEISSNQSDDLVEQLLLNRGVKTKREQELFFNPTIENFKEELDIPNTKKAIERIQQAIENKEQIVVYGDYDVDGVCSTAIMYLGLTSLGATVLPFIPHREHEGYGLSIKGIDKVKELGAKLIITVDNGIVAVEQSKYVKSLGMDLIITDHHEEGEIKPDALAIIHTTKMCAAGVAWSIIRNLIDKKLSNELLQFVCLATICDMMPLLGVNRAFVKQGLKILNTTQNIGLLTLMTDSGLNIGSVTSYDIGHVLGPRLNAIGRLEHAIDALRLLCTNNAKRAKELSRLLCDTNAERQKLTMSGVDGAKLLIVEGKNIYVLDSEDWVPGVIGLIAGKVCEEYYKPVIAISKMGEISKGSARSVEGVNIVELLRSCKDLLIDIGGHSKAAGFTIETAKIEQFKLCIEKQIEKLPILQGPVIRVDFEIKIDQVDEQLVELIKQFEPFGLGNPRVLFASRGLKIQDIKTVGSDNRHLKFKVSDGKRLSGFYDLDAIAFGLGEYSKDLEKQPKADLVFYPDINRFNGSEKLQISVKDIHLIDKE